MKVPDYMIPQEDETFFSKLSKPASCTSPVLWDRPSCDIAEPEPKIVVPELVPFKTFNRHIKKLPPRRP